MFKLVSNAITLCYYCFFSTEFHFDFYTAISYEFSKQSTRLWSLFLFNLTRKICNLLHFNQM